MAQHQTLDVISGRLDGIRGSIKRLFLLDGVGRLLLAVGAFVVATFLLDYLFILPREVRLLFLVAGLAGFSWITAKRIVYPMSVKISDDDLAIFVERHYPELKDRLISALQLARSGSKSASEGWNSPELIDALVADATQAASAIDFNQVVVRTHVLKIAGWAAALVLLLGGFGAAKSNLARIYAKRILGGTTKWPQRTLLTVSGFVDNKKVIARGDDLTIGIIAKGEEPRRVRIYYKFESGEEGKEILARAASPNKNESVWTFTFPRVSGPFTFRAEGNDDITDVQTVETKNPPAIEEMRIFLDFPDYLGLQDTPDDRPESNPNLQVPLFTRVRFVAVCNEALAEATIRVGSRENGAIRTLLVDPDEKGVKRIVKGDLDVVETFTEYEFTIKAVNGLTNRDPLSYSIKAAPDLAPVPQVHDPTGDETATELCERPLTIETRDDHGIKEITVDVKIIGAKSTDWQGRVLTKDHNRPPDYGPQQDRIRSEYLLKISEMGVKPGEFVVIRIRAEDYKNIGGANIAKTKEYKFTIVPITVLEKELQDAIDRIKLNLESLRKRQHSGYDRAVNLDRKYGTLDEKLGADASGEVKSAALEQNDITSKLDGARKDIERVMRRGLYNKIFDENAANELGKAVTILKQLADTSDPARPGTSALAASFITQAARAAKSKDRRDQFSEALNLQSAVIKGIQDALRYLDRWSNYQEIVRMTREILEAQKEINKTIPGLEK
jgi:hypothetical protein